MDLERVAAWLEGLEPAETPADIAAWAAPQAREGHLQLGCTRGHGAARSPDGARLHCLSALTWRDLARLRGLGVTQLTLVWSPEGCASCALGPGPSLPIAGLPVRLRPDWERRRATAPGVSLDRRDLLLGLLPKPVQKAAAQETGHALAEGIASLPPEQPLPMRRKVARPGCTLCGGCGNLCAALQVSGDTLSWRPDRCEECGRCESLCPAGVLGSGEPVLAGEWNQAIPLAVAPERRCACGEPYRNSDPTAPCIRCHFATQRRDPDDTHPQLF